nr:immunoglobulin heavy chain junction region [Macaca mulatta]
CARVTYGTSLYW